MHELGRGGGAWEHLNKREVSMPVMWFSPDLEMKVRWRFTNTAIKLRGSICLSASLSWAGAHCD